MSQKLFNRKSWAVAVIVPAILVATYLHSQKVDLIGGTSLVYQIDTNRLGKDEISGLSKKTIQLLRKRIDPGNYLRLVWTPKNETSFEVCIPLPDKKVKHKYEIYREAILQLEKVDINPNEAFWYYAIDEIPQSIENDQDKLNAIKKYNNSLEKYIPYLGIYDPEQNTFDLNYIKYQIAKTGYLEFRILPTLGCPDSNINEIEKNIQLFETKGPKEVDNERYIWTSIKDVDSWIRENGDRQIQSKVVDEDGNAAIIKSYKDKYYVLASNEPSKCMLHTRINKWKIEEVSMTKDSMGHPLRVQKLIWG